MGDIMDHLNKLEEMYKKDQIGEIVNQSEGLRYLYIKSLSRSIYMDELIKQFSLSDKEKLLVKEKLPLIFCSPLRKNEIQSYINQKYIEERKKRLLNEDELYNELYKLKEFDWGGLYQNSLEQTIVNNYIKKIPNYNELEDHINNSLQDSLRGYVRCSWYNHWTSIMIEDIFKDFSRVTPALGQIKKIDFFIDETPFDLKVTYLPEGFIKQKRKEEGLRPELTLLKQSARDLSISFDKSTPSADLLQDLWLKHKEYNSSNKLVLDLERFRKKLVEEVQSNPDSLMIWLYENQGIRRFDSANRFFIVFINNENAFEGWTMKRSLPLIKKSLKEYFSKTQKIGKKINFNWENKTYATTSDMILISN